MIGYKRNQLEEAISRVLEPRAPEPTSEFRTRLKRLLEADRALGRTPLSADPKKANYAFYSVDPPGRGTEIWFSGYEAFGLLTGLRLMEHGWPQGRAVLVMRTVRHHLEIQHTRTLKQDPAALFDEERIRQDAKEGDFAFDNTDPVLLVITSGRTSDGEDEDFSCAICRGTAAAMEYTRQEGPRGWTMFELATTAHRLSAELTKTEPRHRGRDG
jgi:hypothetical protein